MPVWFAYRSFDVGPTGKHLKRFEDDTVLDWFRNRWAQLAVADEDAEERLADEVGCGGWFLWNPFRVAAEGQLPPPADHAELMELLRGTVEDVRSDSPHDLQVFTEED